jgi:hypothetical protein
VNVDTGAFQALTAQVAALAEEVRGLAARGFSLDAAFRAGCVAGEVIARDAMPGQAPRTARTARPRPRHLRAVGGAS